MCLITIQKSILGLIKSNNLIDLVRGIFRRSQDLKHIKRNNYQRAINTEGFVNFV